MAFDTFMWFPKPAGVSNITIKGETTDSTMAANKAFEIYSFSWGASNPVTLGSASGGAGGGKVSLSSFNIMKKLDGSSTSLFEACATGSHFPSAKVVMRKAGGTQLVYLTYDLVGVYVESVQWSGSSGGDDTPTESVSFGFGAVHISYQPQKEDGTANGTALLGSWNAIKNVKDVTVPA